MPRLLCCSMEVYRLSILFLYRSSDAAHKCPCIMRLHRHGVTDTASA